MISFLKAVRKYLSLIEIKFYCCLLAFSICISLVILYSQYRLAIQDLLKNIETNIAISSLELNDSFASYNAIFNIISARVNNGDNISNLIKQFYTTSKTPSSTKISFLDINWQGIKGNIINRYGQLPALTQYSYLETHARTSPKQAFLYNIVPENTISSTNEYFLTMGVINSKKVYLGRLTILLDLKTWMHELGVKLQNQGLIAILVDPNYKMSLSSNKEVFNATNFQSKLANTERLLAQPVKLKNFTITHCLPIEPHDYKLLFGYNKQFLYNQIFQRSMPLLLVFWCSALIFAIAQFVYAKILKSDIFAGFKSNIKELSHENLKQKEQLDKYGHEATSYKNKLNASKISSRAKEELELQISKRFISTIIELTETARVIGQSIEGELNLKMNYDKQVELLVNINNKLASIVRGHVCNKKNDQINLETVINDTIDIFAEEIFERKLSIRQNIKHKNRNLYQDELLIRRILASLLCESISCSKPNGKIKIFANNEFIEAREHLVVKITDDGFGVPDNEAESERVILPLILDPHSINDIIESNGGELQIEYVIGHGKTITCSLPYNDIKISYDNVIELHKKD